MICGSSTFPYLYKGGYKYLHCPKCSLFFMNPLPTSEELLLFYSKDYFEKPENDLYTYRCGYDNYEEFMSFKKTFYEFLLKEINHYMVRDILDVGAAYGGFVSFLNERGVQASGIEISEFATRRAQENGIDITCASLESFANGTNVVKSFDMLCMLDVFEHFYDYTKVFMGSRSLLKANGLLLIITPSSNSTAARILKKKWYHFLPPQHTHIFNEQNIIDLLSKYDFKVISSSYISKQFSLKYFLHIFEGWSHIKLPKYLVRRFGNFVFTFPMRDNMMIIARKI